jgi:hypothetical protein
VVDFEGGEEEEDIIVDEDEPGTYKKNSIHLQ